MDHDITLDHRVHLTQEFFADFGFPLLDHPPYSPDLVPCDFSLFPKVKKIAEMTRFFHWKRPDRRLRQGLCRSSKGKVGFDFLIDFFVCKSVLIVVENTLEESKNRAKSQDLSSEIRICYKLSSKHQLFLEQLPNSLKIYFEIFHSH